jgi:hypothetical protein
VRRVLNHKDKSVLGVHYDMRDGLREKQDALSAWARKLEEVTFGISPQVIELKRRRG